MPSNFLQHEVKRYSEWRGQLVDVIDRMGQFLRRHKVTDMRTHYEFNNVLNALSDDRITVAVVAEFSRGKTELINTLFFGNFSQRILPSGSGRTTMCPTEILYDPDIPTSVRLLPISSRGLDTPIFDLKQQRSEWKEIPFDYDDVQSVVDALKDLTENIEVSVDEARRLRFEIDETGASGDLKNGLRPDANGTVRIPKWRHAIINLPHPLLQQGLVILDTPGLNAIGAEPELTMSQIASAHAVIFVLSNDTGVTASDLSLWEQFLAADDNDNATNRDTDHRRRLGRNLVVLNKIDMLWDGLLSETEIQQEINKQIDSVEHVLGVPRPNIYPLSAQKGLLAKISDNAALLERSRVPMFENSFVQRLVPEKREVVAHRISRSVEDVVESANVILSKRLRDADAHIAEVKQLSTKNQDVIAHIMVKVQAEKAALENDMKRYQALRAVYSRETTKLLRILNPNRIEARINKTHQLLEHAATSAALERAMTHFFLQLHDFLGDAAMQANEIAYLCENITNEFEQDHGISNFQIRRLRLERYKQDIARLELKHRSVMDSRSMFFREQYNTTHRFFKTVCDVTRRLFESALRDATRWNNNLMVPMETYVREHHGQLRQRLESVKRIHAASDTLEARLQELEGQRDQMVQQKLQFASLSSELKNLLLFDDKGEGADSADILVWPHQSRSPGG